MEERRRAEEQRGSLCIITVQYAREPAGGEPPAPHDPVTSFGLVREPNQNAGPYQAAHCSDSWSLKWRPDETPDE